MAENTKKNNAKEELDNIIVLYDAEDDKDIECELLDTIEHDGSQYAVMLPTDSEDGTVIIMEMVPDTESDEEEAWLFNGIEDNDLLETIYTIFKDNNKDEFDFV